MSGPEELLPLVVIPPAGMPTNLHELGETAAFFGVQPSDFLSQFFGTYANFGKWIKHFRCNPEDN